MTKRYEVGTADCDLKVIAPDAAEDAGLEDLPPGDYALVIGNPWASAFAVVGAPEALRRFAGRVADSVQSIRPVISGSIAAPQAGLDRETRTGGHVRELTAPHATPSPEPDAYALTISHRHGDDTTVHAGDEAARVALAAFARQWWHEILDYGGRATPGVTSPPPYDDDEAIRIYFDHRDDESYSITPATMPTRQARS